MNARAIINYRSDILHSLNTKKMEIKWAGYQVFKDVKKYTSTIQVRREIRYNITAGLVQAHEIARLITMR